MKIEKMVDEWALWNFVRANLPSSLVPMKRGIGYGYVCFIYHHSSTPNLLQRMFGIEGDPIAHVLEESVELYEPQYFSDFEALCQKYESETKRKVTFRYWEQ
jgi:hypothetical protein